MGQDITVGNLTRSQTVVLSYEEGNSEVDGKAEQFDCT